MISNSGTSTLGLYDLKRQIDAFGGVDYFRQNLTGGYLKNARVMLANGDIVKSTVDGNVNDPNVDMTGWEKPQEINKMLCLSKVSDLPSTGFNGQIAMVYNDLRGGKFYYDPARATENNGGTVFNGWVRKYFGSVYLEWFCETDPKTTDCSIYMERALSVTKGVKAGGRDFLFTGRVGIPDTDQNNYAQRTIKIHGDGDTVFHIDCKLHGRATFTSYLGKADPTSEANNFVGKVDFKGISFIGVNTTKGHDLTEANKNLIDKVFDGDRIYNSFVSKCNFTHLYAALYCQQDRGASVEGGNAYSQSFSFVDNHFYHLTHIAEADCLINFRFLHNQCEMNYGGFKIHSKSTSAALLVCSFDYNLFEGGGVFMDILGDAVGGSIWNNYFEYNIFGDIPTKRTQIQIVGESKGCVIGVNSFGGQINFTGYDTDYVDIKVTGKPYSDSNQTDVTTSKPVLIGNITTSRKLISDSRGIGIGNSTPYTLKNGWQRVVDGAAHFNSMMLHSAQENDVSYSRGIFSKPLNYTANAVDGHAVTTLRASDSGVIVAILDLSRIEGATAKNKISTITGELDCNIDLIRDGLTISNVSAKIHVSIMQTGFGEAPQNQYNQLRVNSKLISIIQPYDIPIVSNFPTNLMKKQFVEPDVRSSIEPLGGGRYAVRLTNYLGAASGTFGAPLDIHNSFTWRGSVGCRQVQDQIGANVTFIGFWW